MAKIKFAGGPGDNAATEENGSVANAKASAKADLSKPAGLGWLWQALGLILAAYVIEQAAARKGRNSPKEDAAARSPPSGAGR